jgi:hypothetical protein
LPGGCCLFAATDGVGIFTHMPDRPGRNARRPRIARLRSRHPLDLENNFEINNLTKTTFDLLSS